MTCAVCGAPAAEGERWCSSYCRRRERGARVRLKLWALWAAVAPLLGCVSTLHRWLAGSPDLRAPSGPVVYLQGHPADGYLAEIERVHAAAVRLCPPDRLQALDAAWKGIEVRVVTDPKILATDCLRPAHGCAWGNGGVFVEGVDVIPDELGHLAMWACDGDPGEVTLADGGVVYDQGLIDLIEASEPPPQQMPGK